MINLKIAVYRKKHDLTQVALATQLGVSFQTVSKWENGINYPDIYMISKMCDLFGITIDELVGRISHPGVQYDRKDTETYWGKEISYLEETRKDLWNDDYFEFLVKQVWQFKQPIDVIDFGCGFGYLGMKLLPLLPEGSSYTGVDVSKELLNKAKKIFKETSFDVRFINSDLYEFKPSEKYDLSICQAFLRHLTKPEVVLNKMVQSAKSGGKVVCIEINRCFEELGYYNSQVGYNPFINLRIFETIWNNELNSGGRDFSIGIKMPHLMSKLGLLNLESRVNDKVTFISRKLDAESYQKKMSRFIDYKGWGNKDLENRMTATKIRLNEEGITTEEVEVYLNQFKKNILNLTGPETDTNITYTQGLMITYGTKE